MRAIEFLSEMIVRYKSNDPEWLIAYKDSIWLIAEEDLESDYSNDEGNFPGADLKNNILNVIDPGKDDDSIDSQEFIERIRETRPDVFIASIDMKNKELQVDLMGEVSSLHPKTSQLVKKVVKQLGIQSINGNLIRGLAGGESEITYYPDQLKGKMPKHGYHGTTMGKLLKIMKTGIVPQDSGNWDKLEIHTPNVIFFAVDDSISEFHAERTANKEGDIPVIIHFKIPDENRIVPDYDIAQVLYGSGTDITQFYGKNIASSLHNEDWKRILSQTKRPEKLHGQFGVFGYKGRIPPNHFIEFTTTLEPYENDGYGEQMYIYADRQQMIEYLKIYNEFGYDIMNSGIHGLSYDYVKAEFEAEIGDDEK